MRRQYDTPTPNTCNKICLIVVLRELPFFDLLLPVFDQKHHSHPPTSHLHKCSSHWRQLNQLTCAWRSAALGDFSDGTGKSGLLPLFLVLVGNG